MMPCKHPSNITSKDNNVWGFSAFKVQPLRGEEAREPASGVCSPDKKGTMGDPRAPPSSCACALLCNSCSTPRPCLSSGDVDGVVRADCVCCCRSAAVCGYVWCFPATNALSGEGFTLEELALADVTGWCDASRRAAALFCWKRWARHMLVLPSSPRAPAA
jgi:hypothetical protein